MNMRSNFLFLQQIRDATTIFEACHCVEKSLVYVSAGTAIREARHALEVLINYYIYWKDNNTFTKIYEFNQSKVNELSQMPSEKAERHTLYNKINISYGLMGNITGMDILRTDIDNFIKLGNIMVHNDEHLQPNQLLQDNAVNIIQKLQSIAIFLVNNIFQTNYIPYFDYSVYNKGFM